MEWIRTARSPWGQEVVLGASWDLLWLFAGAGVAFIAAHMLSAALLGRHRRRPGAGAESGDTGRVIRHRLPDRLYHWAMALSVLTLLATGFIPIVGVKFAWVAPHWIAGLVLAALLLFHIARALIWQDIRSMAVGRADLRDARRALQEAVRGPGSESPKPGKYQLMQKVYHHTVALAVLITVGTGLPMMVKVDTPLWPRDPYWLPQDVWGILYVAHGFAAMAVLAMVLAHVYFGLRPDKFWITRSMILGWITRRDYLEHHDPERWADPGAAGRAPPRRRAAE